MDKSYCASLNGFSFRCISRRNACGKNLELKRSSCGWEPSGARALCIFAGGDGARTHAHMRAQVYTWRRAHAPIICTLQIYNTTIHIRRPPVGAETQEGRALLCQPAPAAAYAPLSASVFPPVLSYPFPPLQGDVERRNARESYLSHIPYTCELSTYALSSMIFTCKFDALIQIWL